LTRTDTRLGRARTDPYLRPDRLPGAILGKPSYFLGFAFERRRDAGVLVLLIQSLCGL
jgi:hypothetical protein